MKIKLVENGIFPIVQDKDGNPLKPDTDIDCSGTAQGEGKLLGTTCLFIRLSGCNLRCTWELWDGTISICDTAYSSHNATNFSLWDIDDVILTVKKNINNLQHIVISGGEPTMQEDELGELTKKIKTEFPYIHITVETNGTHFSDKFAKYVDLYSISPKLSDSVPTETKLVKMNILASKEFTDHETNRKRYSDIQRYIDMCYTTNIFGKKYRNKKHDFQLKFVVSNSTSELEVKEILNSLNGVTERDVYLMPAGGNSRLLKKTTPVALESAIRNGWQFTPRLHIELFGNKKGV